jgi:hypothetical protein
MTEVLQCPYCDLRFSTRSELEQHKAFDHPGKEQEPPAAVAPPASAVQPAVQPESVKEPKPPAEKRGFLSRLFKRS